MTASAAAPPLDPYRLPRAVVPTRYDVELAPDLAAATFDGRGRRSRSTSSSRSASIVLNAIELDIVEVPRRRQRRATWHLEPATERLVVTPAGGSQPGRRRIDDRRSPACSTTSCAASTAAPSPTTTAPSR